jgi:hydrogenase maturation protease
MTLVIGYGNPLRSDDGLGQYLAQRIGRGSQVMTHTQLIPELAEPISRVERVIFIDAGMGATPGDVTYASVVPLPLTGAFTHNVTPASLLAAAQELYGAAPGAILITVTGASFDYGCAFSPPIHAQLPQVVNRVEAIIAAFSGSIS